MFVTEPDNGTSHEIKIFRPGVVAVRTFKSVMFAIVAVHFTVRFHHLFSCMCHRDCETGGISAYCDPHVTTYFTQTSLLDSVRQYYP